MFSRLPGDAPDEGRSQTQTLLALVSALQEQGAELRIRLTLPDGVRVTIDIPAPDPDDD